MVGNQLWVRNVMVPFREILQMAEDLSCLLLSAKRIKSQDFFALLWLARSSFSKKVFLATRKTLLYKFLNFLNDSSEAGQGLQKSAFSMLILVLLEVN